MSDGIQQTVPAAAPPPPVEPIDVQLAQMKKWIEGYIDPDGSRHAGLIEMVGELYKELTARRERREAFLRAFTTGSVLAMFAFSLNWLKDHLK